MFSALIVFNTFPFYTSNFHKCLFSNPTPSFHISSTTFSPLSLCKLHYWTWFTPLMPLHSFLKIDLRKAHYYIWTTIMYRVWINTTMTPPFFCFVLFCFSFTPIFMHPFDKLILGFVCWSDGMWCGAAEATDLGSDCFVIIKPRVLSANHKFSNTPPPSFTWHWALFYVSELILNVFYVVWSHFTEQLGATPPPFGAPKVFS